MRKAANHDQKNTNGDNLGNASQMGDQDNDGALDFRDNCRYLPMLIKKILIMMA